MLYFKRKFDIRCYLLISSINGVIKGYWYQDGYVRTTSKEFTLKNFNRYLHLTNDFVQKKDEGYGKYERSNKISFEELDKYLSTLDTKIDFYKEIYP
jgi:hypothetical protein